MMHLRKEIMRNIFFTSCIFCLPLSASNSNNNDLFCAIYKPQASPFFLGRVNSLIDAFILAKFEIKKINNQTMISCRYINKKSVIHSIDLKTAHAVLIGVYEKVKSATNVGIKPTFILNRAGYLSPCPRNISQIQALRLYDFVRGKIYISDEKIAEYDSYMACRTDEQKERLVGELTKVALSIVDNRNQYFQAFAQGDAERLAKAMGDTVDWEYLALEKYFSRVNSAIHEVCIQEGASLLADVVKMDK